MSYNALLNPTETYRRALIDALVSGDKLPQLDDQSAAMTTIDDDSFHNALVLRHSDPTSFMNLQQQEFGPIKTSTFKSVIASVRQSIAAPPEPLLAALLTRGDKESYIPNAELFQTWHSVHREYFEKIINDLKTIIPYGAKERNPVELKDVFMHALTAAGLYARGWRVIYGNKVNLVGVASTKKRIIVTKRPIILSKNRLIGLVLHEVAIHALAAEHHQNRNKDLEEGIGTLVEQLTLQAFYPLRLYRYLAICFAAGVDGTPRTARDTFELVVSVRRALRPLESLEASRRFVATEVVRVYRTLPTDVAGIVYLRDKKYVEYNVQLWSTLRTEAPTIDLYQSIVAPWADRASK